jgi:RNA-binding protein
MPLTSKQRAYLRGLAHDLEPVVLIGHKGITAAVIAEASHALLAHELIKVRLAEGDEGGEADLAEGTRAEVVARIGRVAILYKQHPQKPKIKLPRKKSK